MTNDECWTMNDGGKGEIGEKYQEMAKDRSEGTQPKGSMSCFEMPVVGPGNDQSGLLPRCGVAQRARYRVGGDSTTLAGIIHECVYTSTGEEWHICSFNAQPEAPAFFAAGPGQAGASGWALNESFSTGSGIVAHFRAPCYTQRRY